MKVLINIQNEDNDREFEKDYVKVEKQHNIYINVFDYEYKNTIPYLCFEANFLQLLRNNAQNY